MAGKRYVLVEWLSDSSVSVVPVSRLKSRNGDEVTQAWPSGIFAGKILDEGDCKKDLDRRAIELVKEASPKKTKTNKKTATSSTKTTPRKKQADVSKKRTKSAPPKSVPSKKNKLAKQKLAEIERVQKEAEWLFGTSSEDDGDKTDEATEDEDLGGATKESRNQQDLGSSSMYTPSHASAQLRGRGSTRRSLSDITSTRRSFLDKLHGPSHDPSLGISSISRSFSHRSFSSLENQSRSHDPFLNATSDRSMDQTFDSEECYTPPFSDLRRSASRSMDRSLNSEERFRDPSSSVRRSVSDRSPYQEHGVSRGPSEQRSRSGSVCGFPEEVGVKVEQPRMVELVEGLGVYVPAHQLLAATQAAKSASSLVRQLMDIVFTKEELSTCSVRGKGTRPGLPQQKLEAVIGYVLSKYPNERTEYLIRQANDKLS